MIIVKIQQLLDDQDKTIYWLSKQTGISHNNLTKIVKGETRGIHFDPLERICLALNCDIVDVIEIKKED